MKRVRLNSHVRKAFQDGSRGFTLIEVVIAIALLGIVGAAVLSALSTGSLALIIADQRVTAESLARSEMEYIKNSGYDGNLTHAYPQYSLAPGIIIPPSYAINITAVRLNRDLDPNDDDGLQQITVTVTYYTVRGDNGMREQKYTLVDYKRNPKV